MGYGFLLTECLGPGTLRAHVDSQLHSLSRISLSNDTVEGMNTVLSI